MRQASAFGVRLPKAGSGVVSVPGLDALIAHVETHDAFREQLAVSLRHADGASLDHPVGNVLFASVAEAKLVNVFNALAAQASLASVIADGSADPDTEMPTGSGTAPMGMAGKRSDQIRPTLRCPPAAVRWCSARTVAASDGILAVRSTLALLEAPRYSSIISFSLHATVSLLSYFYLMF